MKRAASSSKNTEAERTLHSSSDSGLQSQAAQEDCPPVSIPPTSVRKTFRAASNVPAVKVSNLGYGQSCLLGSTKANLYKPIFNHTIPLHQQPNRTNFSGKGSNDIGTSLCSRGVPVIKGINSTLHGSVAASGIWKPIYGAPAKVPVPNLNYFNNNNYAGNLVSHDHGKLLGLGGYGLINGGQTYEALNVRGVGDSTFGDYLIPGESSSTGVNHENDTFLPAMSPSVIGQGNNNNNSAFVVDTVADLQQFGSDITHTQTTESADCPLFPYDHQHQILDLDLLNANFDDNTINPSNDYHPTFDGNLNQKYRLKMKRAASSSKNTEAERTLHSSSDSGLQSQAAQEDCPPVSIPPTSVRKTFRAASNVPAVKVSNLGYGQSCLLGSTKANLYKPIFNHTIPLHQQPNRTNFSGKGSNDIGTSLCSRGVPVIKGINSTLHGSVAASGIWKPIYGAPAKVPVPNLNYFNNNNYAGNLVSHDHGKLLGLGGYGLINGGQTYEALNVRGVGDSTFGDYLIPGESSSTGVNHENDTFLPAMSPSVIGQGNNNNNSAFVVDTVADLQQFGSDITHTQTTESADCPLFPYDHQHQGRDDDFFNLLPNLRQTSI
ncbi:hypothetical protein Dsin_014770 [Dipteronia sinensis]|uniref:Uncharacterized protein n=1 Tax=Dipteronia sinensis TaxID=43782 RepID=A0AAE0ANH5_9ROSI|nr:hypothetical protein Dsin_014770 [Dipteronia sinensis]